MLLLLLLSSPLCLLLFAVRVRFVGLGNNLKLFRLKLLVAVVAAALAPCAIPTAACCCSFCCFCWRFKVSNAVFSLALSILGQNLVWCLAKAFNFPRRNCLHYRPVLLLCSKVLLAHTYTHTGAHTDTPAHTHTQPPTHAAQINCCCFRRLFVFEICFLNGNALCVLCFLCYLDHGPPLGHLICCCHCRCRCSCCSVCLLPICYLNLICIT